jgi:phage terminase small subunit
MMRCIVLQKRSALATEAPNVTGSYPTQSPYLSTVNRQAEIMLRIASEFGFTPASRSRIFSYSKSNSLLLDAEKEPDDGLTKW